MLPTATNAILAALLVSGASAAVTGCAAPADPASNGDQNVGRVIQPIIGGSASGTADDAVVVLTVFNQGQRAALCTATLVAPNLIVTARHCVSKVEGATACAQDGSAVTGGSIAGTYKASALVVFTGANGVTPDSTVEAKAAAHGKQIIVDAATNVCDHDIAFVQLDKDVSAPIAPIRIGAPSASEHVAAVGWGVDASGNLPNHRLVRDLALVGVGPAPFPNNPSWGYGDHEFMVGEGPCAGDSGSPAFAKSGALVGIGARTGNGKASDGNYATTCTGSDAHTVYTHLAGFQKLIDAAFKTAGHTPVLEGTGNTGSSSGASGSASGGSSGGGGTSSGSSGSSGDAPLPVIAESANADLLGGGDEPPAPGANANASKKDGGAAEAPAADTASAEDGAGGGCSMSGGAGAANGDAPHDNVAYAAGLVALVALVLGLRRRLRHPDGKDDNDEPPPPREPYESMM